MKTILLLFAAILFVGISAQAQFNNGQAADLVYGQADYTHAQLITGSVNVGAQGSTGLAAPTASRRTRPQEKYL